MDSFENEIDEGGIESGTHRQKPKAIVRERSAFYRVLFGHQNRPRAGEIQVLA